ncbi:AsmA family protein [Jiella flava]|uniref:AsmA family protein n=1 Tax=Jiella flava TaxID=2816857 RepID=A0A939FWQ5_9HYPH|nr:AsmA-like C-terminal region-containing protein [Jiella flava]MBO0661570.1 AsmA family protein [Jiella flava]
MTTASGSRPARRKWLALALAASLAAIIAVVAVLPGLALGSDQARTLVIERLEQLTGRHVSVDGRIDFSILPRARLSLEHVRLGSTNGIDIDRLVANFSLLDVFAGKGEISRLVLVRPEWQSAPPIDDAVAAAAKANAASGLMATGTGEGLMTGLHRLMSRLQGVRAIEIRDGLFRPSEPGFEGSRGISNANVTIKQSTSGDSLSLSGSFVWNGQPTTVDLGIDSSKPLRDGGSGNVDLSLDSPALTASFKGTAEFDRLRDAQGKLSIAGPSFTRGIEWLFSPDLRVPEIGAVALSGDLMLRGKNAELRNANLSIAGSQGHGAMEARIDDGIPVVGGTLAFDSLNITPVARSIAPFPRNAFDFERPLDVDFAKAMRMEIRLSASDLQLGTVPFKDVAAVISADGGIAKLEVGDATIFGGRGQATLTVDGRPATPGVEGWFSASNIDMGHLFTGLSIKSIGMSGTSSITAKLSAPAKNWRTILAGLKISAKLATTNGTLSGFDPRVFARPGARPLAAGSGDGMIPFSVLNATVDLQGSTLTFQPITIRNDAGSLSASGDYHARTNTIDLNGNFVAAAPATASADPATPAIPQKTIAFDMKGNWPNPSVTTKAASPI